MYGSLLTPSVLSKLPKETHGSRPSELRVVNWRCYGWLTPGHSDPKHESSVYWETWHARQHPTPMASFSTHTDGVPHPRNSQQRKQTECTFCKGNHKTNSCNVIVDPKERLAIVKWDGLCLARHKASQCSSRFTCRMCKKMSSHQPLRIIPCWHTTPISKFSTN